MDVMRWSLTEKLSEAARSFFIFDEYRPYSINFLWGPMLALNPTERHAVFQDLPPQQIYAMYILNIGLLITLGIIILIVSVRRTPDRKRVTAKAFGFVVLTVWILMDLRMGSEFLTWVNHDRTRYISATREERSFRDRGQFYDFAEAVKPFVSDRTSYVFFAQQAWPYLGNMRYLTYPSIPGINVEEDDTWVIYDRPDLKVSAEGQITVSGDPVSKTGRILFDYGEGSFVFRTLAPPSQQ